MYRQKAVSVGYVGVIDGDDRIELAYEPLSYSLAQSYMRAGPAARATPRPFILSRTFRKSLAWIFVAGSC
jgi:hypothetical protein